MLYRERVEGMRWLLLAFLLIPALEIGVFIWAGGVIGPWSVVAVIILTGILGVALAKQQGMETWKKAQLSMQYGIVPTEQVIDGLCILLGGLLLVTPGFITDIIGLILILPFTRYPIKLQIEKFLRWLINRQTIVFRR